MRAFAPTFHEIQIVIRDLVSDIRGVFFYHMTNRYQKQGTIKTISKIIVTFVNFGSFPAISEDFNQFSHLSAPLKNPPSGKGAHKL